MLSECLYLVLQKEAKMIIVRIAGGLGNQLFQYALYSKLKKAQEVYADISAYGTKREKRKYELDLLGLNVDQPSAFNLFRLSHVGKGIVGTIGNRLPKPKTFISEDELGTYKYHSEILGYEEAYLAGYWQCVDYFSDIKDEILSLVRFKVPEDNSLLEIIESIKRDNSVSVHMRFGDYLDYSSIYGGICTKEYYGKAIDIIRDKVDKPVFYVFSDDIGRSKEMLAGYSEEIRYVDVNNGDASYLDMYLMSLCKHNIIANSSFSFWGAYLNTHQDKVVICPDRWINSDEINKIALDGWIEIKGCR